MIKTFTVAAALVLAIGSRMPAVAGTILDQLRSLAGPQAGDGVPEVGAAAILSGEASSSERPSGSREAIDGRSIREYMAVCAAGEWDRNNQCIERYFKRNRDHLTWPQVAALLAGLRHAGLDFLGDDDNRPYTQDRITKSYFRRVMKSLQPAGAVEIARRQASPLDTNALLESYVSAHKSSLDYQDIATVLAGLRHVEWALQGDSNNAPYARDRIIRAWSERHRTK